MYDLSQNYDSYVAILNDHIYTNMALLLLLFAAVVGITFGVIWFIRRKRNKENTIKENVEIIVCFSLLIVAVIGVTVTCCKGLSQAIYDKDHQAYEVIEAPFRVKMQEYGWGIRSSEVYSIIYEKDGDYVEMDVETFIAIWNRGAIPT